MARRLAPRLVARPSGGEWHVGVLAGVIYGAAWYRGQFELAVAGIELQDLAEGGIFIDIEPPLEALDAADE